MYEKNDDVGGNWLYTAEPGHSSVFETTHIISSKAFSQYAVEVDYHLYREQLLRALGGLPRGAQAGAA